MNSTIMIHAPGKTCTYQTPDWTYVNKPFATLVPHYGTPFPSTLRMLRPSNYLNEAWNHIYYLLRCSLFKWPCSTSFKTEQLYKHYHRWTKNPTFSSYASYGGILFFNALLTLFAAISLHVCKSKFFFPRVVNKSHTVSTSLCLMYMILLLPCCLWCLYFRQ